MELQNDEFRYEVEQSNWFCQECCKTRAKNNVWILTLYLNKKRKFFITIGHGFRVVFCIKKRQQKKKNAQHKRARFNRNDIVITFYTKMYEKRDNKKKFSPYSSDRSFVANSSSSQTEYLTYFGIFAALSNLWNGRKDTIKSL